MLSNLSDVTIEKGTVMKTALRAVVDGRLTDEALGKIHRKVDDLKRRISEGTLDFSNALDGIQRIIEGCVSQSGKDELCFAIVNDEVCIEIPALPRPTLPELQAKYPWIKSIERDDSPEGPVTLRLATVLKPKEPSINGEVYEQRLMPLKDQLLGFQHQQWLLEHQKEFPELMALLGRVYLDFSGIFVVSDDGSRDCPDLYQGDRRWDGSWYWVSSGFGGGGRVAVSGK